MKKGLIIQGGGFRTAFAAGVLDGFLEHDHRPFDVYCGVSGGAIAASYYIANQPRHCFDAISFLAANKRFLNLARLLKNQAMMDVEIFYDISNKFMPFDFETAIKNIKDRNFTIVMTDKLHGQPCYFNPNRKNWQDAIIASCSLPFITNGKHLVEEHAYMDGAWSDPLPIEWMTKQGAKEITIVRTAPANEKIGKSWLDTIGEYYYFSNKNLKNSFVQNHQKYNQAIDFINDPPKGIKILQVAPEKKLKAGLYTDKKELVREDYEYGLEMGNDFCLNHS